MKKIIMGIAAVTILFSLSTAEAYDGRIPFYLEIESGAVFTGYNDARIPGDEGTKFSLSEELEADPEWYWRLRAGFLFAEKHYAGAVIAPLTVHSSGKPDRDLRFKNTTFDEGEKTDAAFKFNSYRLLYRYIGYNKNNLRAGIGVTAKIRHASIKLKSENGKAEKKDLGFVPIVNFMLHWNFTRSLGFLIDGDALAAPQGRAADILFALTFDMSDTVQARAGYRILEGGADNDEVYTFSMFHYASAGLMYRF